MYSIPWNRPFHHILPEQAVEIENFVAHIYKFFTMGINESVI